MYITSQSWSNELSSLLPSGEGNDSPCAEFNFGTDPEAAQIVLSDKRLPRFTKGGKEGRELSLCPIYITPWETCFYKAKIPFVSGKNITNIQKYENKFKIIPHDKVSFDS